ncbi:unnamed protein product [Rotaria magnacalcarata]|uniref:OTU domain-containing protein n=1 Tax=Rotaria magnacalcarata TaxID=392030 RepID=A0A819VSS8_9BILA|nr:unnamed protein product [Rotaria magnacalcarata]
MEESTSNSTEASKQFPFRLSWAVTIHKAQGLTVDQIVISSKDLFGSGMGYTYNSLMLRKADLICLAETWLENINTIDQYDIENYKFIHCDRTSSFKVDHPLHVQKRGGIVERQDDLIIIVCYRSRTQKKKEFLTNVCLIPNSFDMNKKVLIIGDLNEDNSGNDCKTIETKMSAMKFQNIPTTNHLTSLDCVYSNFLFDIEHHESITETFYSFHEALAFSIRTRGTNNSISIHNQSINDEHCIVANVVSSSIESHKVRATTEKSERKSNDIDRGKEKMKTCVQQKKNELIFPTIDSTFKRYINDMNKNGNYVNHTVISVTARFLQKQIVIHQHRQPLLVISSLVFSQEQLHVCYDPDSGHYESVVRFDNTQYFLSI